MIDMTTGFALMIALSFIGFRTFLPGFIHFMCGLFIILGFFGLFLCSFFSFSYYAAGYHASIINREYGTSYTQAEVFYASDAIERIQEIKRQRLEVNGNVITGENK